MALFQASQLLALARKWLSFCFLLIFRALSFQGVEGGSAIISESQTTVAAFGGALITLPHWRKLGSYNSHHQRFSLVSETSFKSKIHSHACKAGPFPSYRTPALNMSTFLSSGLSFSFFFFFSSLHCHFFKFKKAHWRDELQTEPMLLLEKLLKEQALENNRLQKQSSL